MGTGEEGVRRAGPGTGAPAGSGEYAGGREGAAFEQLWVDPRSSAARQVTEWRIAGRAADAELMDRIASRPQAEWVTGTSPRTAVQAVTTAAARAGRAAVLVAYDIPGRDCGQYSGGGALGVLDYRTWVDEFAVGLGDRGAYVIVEPDAVAQVVAGCTQVDAEERYALLAYAVERIKRQPHARVYLDAGNSGWIPQPARLVEALRAAGVGQADGFALNVSNFQTDQDSSVYGDALSRALGGKHYVVDTSRNGNGPYTGTDTGIDAGTGTDAEPWCNPPGRALGTPPTTVTGRPRLDAQLWIKRPGESDGTCRGGPPAGQWWPSYALELAGNARS
ncbi:glycoside hydrolase family 6 protein [Streptomyces sp. SID12488]|uniref:glycoside hydrolase family 6 protein n=1 Tax=Streptomyces sp. SID12488 TaxID=2706040 RepID=UPI0013DCF3FB|nr:glycoside hydrolase family 6 protein [Streptomyces sp. SID12488]NEA68329.1 glycoside hydrolase family 6 protein [Streptomyces sp. SID12488]